MLSKDDVQVYPTQQAADRCAYKIEKYLDE